MTKERLSHVVYIVVRLKLEEGSFLLLMAHRGWGDWSLVGGHVEPREEHSWILAARREAEEELAPLQEGIDFSIKPIEGAIMSWGPEKSRSAGGQPTIYTAAWFQLEFLREPVSCLERLQAASRDGGGHTDAFILISEELVLTTPTAPDVTGLLTRLNTSIQGGLKSVPYAWPSSIPWSPHMPVRRRVAP